MSAFKQNIGRVSGLKKNDLHDLPESLSVILRYLSTSGIERIFVIAIVWSLDPLISSEPSTLTHRHLTGPLCIINFSFTLSEENEYHQFGGVKLNLQLYK